MITLYGIKNCDSVKKARQWLEQRKIPYHFHDYKVNGLARDQLLIWITKLGWEVLLNTRGITWRQLSPEMKANLDEAKAVALMLANTSLIKRPLLDLNGEYKLGFNETEYQRWFP